MTRTTRLLATAGAVLAAVAAVVAIHQLADGKAHAQAQVRALAISPPSVVSFKPIAGPVGTVLALVGRRYASVSSVRFNGVAATFAVVSSTKIVTSVPIGATAGLITVTDPNGTGSSRTSFAVTSTDTVSLTDQTWTCNKAVSLASVRVTITASAAQGQGNGVKITNGCTGVIARISVTDAMSDGLHIDGGTDLAIDGGSIVCNGRADLAHQDGIQATSGTRITFSGVTVRCTTGNNAGLFVNGIGNGTPNPDAILFLNGLITATGSKTASVSDNQTGSGIRYSTLCPSRFLTYQKQLTAIDVGNHYPATGTSPC